MRRSVLIAIYLLAFLAVLAMPLRTIAQVQPVHAAINRDSVKLLTYNTYLLPGIAGSTGQAKRCKLIIKWLAETDYDAVVLQEVFVAKQAAAVTAQLKAVYPYSYRPLIHTTAFQAGHGLLLLSRHPLSDTSFVQYTSCEGTDCYSKKGFLVAKIKKPGYDFLVIGTHMQSSAQQSAIRMSQIKQIRSMLRTTLFRDKDWFLMGDLNVNLYSRPEYTALMDTLQLPVAQPRPQAQLEYKYSPGKLKNPGQVVYNWQMEVLQEGVVKKMPLPDSLDEVSAWILAQQQELFTYNGWENALVNKKWKQDMEWLDYILRSTPTARLYLKRSAIVTPRRNWKPWQINLSDHYGVEAVYFVN